MTLELFLPFIAYAGINIAATLSPGPAFAMTVRNATIHGRSAGIMTSIGLGLGVGIHMILVLTGISVLIMKVPALFYE